MEKQVHCLSPVLFAYIPVHSEHKYTDEDGKENTMSSYKQELMSFLAFKQFKISGDPWLTDREAYALWIEVMHDPQVPKYRMPDSQKPAKLINATSIYIPSIDESASHVALFYTLPPKSPPPFGPECLAQRSASHLDPARAPIIEVADSQDIDFNGGVGAEADSATANAPNNE